MNTSTGNPFYWQTARDELLTPSAITMFLIAAKYADKDFDECKTLIDSDYEVAKGLSPTKRHGGNFQTYIKVFQEAGWMYVEEADDNKILRLTDAGKQAIQLIHSAPGFLKVVPYFLVELLSRYQLNSPGIIGTPKNRAIQEEISKSDIFPYWTIWKVMRSCDNQITIEELQRFVFRLQNSTDINSAIIKIKEFRQDIVNGLSTDELNLKYPLPLAGAIGEPKYIMGRAGMHVGHLPKLIHKVGQSTYELNTNYLPFIDKVLDEEPIFKDDLDTKSWFRDYGRPVEIDEQFVPFSLSIEESVVQLNYSDLPDTDEIWTKVKGFVNQGIRNILFIGPPGTSKTTYALSIGAKLVEHDSKRFRNVQFHQSLGYDEFIEGYVPAENSRASNGFELKQKLFLLACKEAREDNPENLHVLVIDELNRGEPSRIFGEVLTYIERRNEWFSLTYSRERSLVPQNLVVLATMNPHDRSIADLDDALFRRFNAKIKMDPSVVILRHMLIDINQVEAILAGKVVSYFDFLNKEMGNRVGQAYFKDVKDLESLNSIWEHNLMPLLERELRNDPERLARATKKYHDSFIIS